MAHRSPGEIKMMLHYHSSRERWLPVTEWSSGVLDGLLNEGLLECVDGIPVSTPLGAAFVECICSTPVPLVAFIDPRTGERVGPPQTNPA